MSARATLGTILLAAGVSAVVAFGLGVLLTWTLLATPHAYAQGAGPTPGAAPAPGASTSSTTAPLPVMRAERFEVVDARGVVVASLGRQEAAGIRPARTALEFVDATGQPAAAIGMSDRGAAAVSVSDADGRAIALGVSSAPSGEPLGGVGLAIGTPPVGDARTGSLRTMLTLDPDGQSQLLFMDAEGEQRLTLGLRGDGTPALDLDDEAGRPRVTAGVRGDSAGIGVISPDGPFAALTGERGGMGAGLAVYGPRGLLAALSAAGDGRVGLGLVTPEAYRAGFGLSPDGEPFLVIFGAEGHETPPIWQAP